MVQHFSSSFETQRPSEDCFRISFATILFESGKKLWLWHLRQISEGQSHLGRRFSFGKQTRARQTNIFDCEKNVPTHVQMWFNENATLRCIFPDLTKTVDFGHVTETATHDQHNQLNFLNILQRYFWIHDCMVCLSLMWRRWHATWWF